MSQEIQGTINQTSSSSLNSGTNLNNNLPERPDQPDCQHYMKTGGCKYGATCKYNHPKERNSLAHAQVQAHAQAQAQAQAQAINASGVTGIGPLGFPLRPVTAFLFPLSLAHTHTHTHTQLMVAIGQLVAIGTIAWDKEHLIIASRFILGMT